MCAPCRPNVSDHDSEVWQTAVGPVPHPHSFAQQHGGDARGQQQRLEDDESFLHPGPVLGLGAVHGACERKDDDSNTSECSRVSDETHARSSHAARPLTHGYELSSGPPCAVNVAEVHSAVVPLHVADVEKCISGQATLTECNPLAVQLQFVPIVRLSPVPAHSGLQAWIQDTHYSQVAALFYAVEPGRLGNLEVQGR